MLFGWFDAGKSREFGASLARFFIEKIPVDQRFDERTFATKAQKTLEKASIQVVAFQRENRLNVYKKAQLGNVFKWTLKEAGFNPDYVDKLTKWLMLQIS